MSHSDFIANCTPTNRATIAMDIIIHTVVVHVGSAGVLDLVFLTLEERVAIEGVGGSEVEITVMGG